MFFSTADITAESIEVFRLSREPYRKAAPERPFHAISFKLSGTATYECGGQTVTTGPGDILFVPAYADYTKDAEAEEFYVVHFRCKELTEKMPVRLCPANPEAFRSIFQRLHSAYTEKRAACVHECKHLFYQLLMRIEQEQAQNSPTGFDREIQTALGIIHERYTQPDFTVEKLTARLFMSETYFRRRFSKVVGISPKKYISQLRLDHGCRLLRSGYYTVAEVARLCGFSSAYYFSAFIKRTMGVAPKTLIGAPQATGGETGAADP